MISLDDLDYSYPEDLVATEPKRPSRVMFVENCRSNTDYHFNEVSVGDLLSKFKAGDVLLVNDTKVNKRRVYSECGLEILFVEEIEKNRWSCLFPAKKLSLQDLVKLPGNAEMRLEKKGIPQEVWVSKKLDESYFDRWGEFALPPYIQSARGERKNKPQDRGWYQTQWAQKEGSTAAPTASLHFTSDHLQMLEDKGVQVEKLTLHVGLGTFLPIRTTDIENHEMHSEYVSIPKKTIDAIIEAKKHRRTVWAMGTTSARAIESWAKNFLSQQEDKSFAGETDLYITPGFSFEVVDVLMTNFHQPKSTLLALVASFSTIDNVNEVYAKAVEEQFRLFSYGDLSVWARKDLRA